MDVAIVVEQEEAPRARLALLLRHFSELSDDREPGRIMYPLEEVLLLATCATIASCDDFDDIAAWGKHHIGFLRRFSELHFGVPCERWPRSLVNRIDPVLFGRCFDRGAKWMPWLDPRLSGSGERSENAEAPSLRQFRLSQRCSGLSLPKP